MRKIDITQAEAALEAVAAEGKGPATAGATVAHLLPRIEQMRADGYPLTLIHSGLQRQGVDLGSYNSFYTHYRRAVREQEARA